MNEKITRKQQLQEFNIDIPNEPYLRENEALELSKQSFARRTKVEIWLSMADWMVTLADRGILANIMSDIMIELWLV